MGTLSKSTLFPPQLTNELFNMVRGKSSLARLSNQAPLSFNGNTAFTFNFDKEVDLVDENGPKSAGGATLNSVTVIPLKVEYSARMSDEFKFASDEVKLNYLRAFSEGFASKLARGFDIMAMHGVNARTGSDSNLIGNNKFDDAVNQTVTISSNPANPNGDVESAIALVMAQEHEVTGMAMAPSFRSALAAQTRQDGTPLFPELAWGQGGNDKIRGLDVDTNSTVSFNNSGDYAITGNFRDYFRWGIARDIEIKLIEYGNPDNDETLGDLASRNQILLRAEAYIGWGILQANAFSRIVAASVNTQISNPS